MLKLDESFSTTESEDDQPRNREQFLKEFVTHEISQYEDFTMNDNSEEKNKQLDAIM